MESRILAAAADALGEEPFSTRGLADELRRRHPDLKQLAEESLFKYIAEDLKNNGFYRGMIGRVSHWHSHPFVSSKKGEYVHKTPLVTTKLLRHKNILATLFFGFGARPFSTLEAARLIQDTCDYTENTAATYTNKVLAVAAHEPTEIRGQQVMARKVRAPRRGHRMWEIYVV